MWNGASRHARSSCFKRGLEGGFQGLWEAVSEIHGNTSIHIYLHTDAQVECKSARSSTIM